MKKIYLFTLLLFSAFVISAAEPVLRVGIITDTHVNPKKSSCKVLKEALTLFKNHKVDMVINTGDIADHYYEQGYRHYRDTVNEVFADVKDKPQEIFVYANHDWIDRKNEPFIDVFKDVKKHLGIPHDPYDVITLKGYTFVVVPQFMDIARYEAMVSKAVKDSPGKPVFVIDHTPAGSTVYNSVTWGDARRTRMLSKYPQAVQISGHVHGTLTNELNIWQGAFTAVNAGCLGRWGGALIGNEPEMKISDMALILEVYPEKLVFRRFFSTTKEEFSADEPWVVPLPFDPETAPYNPAYRKKVSTTPEFPEKSAVSVSQNTSEMEFVFPRAIHKNGVFNYKTEIFCKNGNKWQKWARRDVMGDFMLPENRRPENVKISYNIGYFDAGKEYKAVITPLNFFGKAGKAVSAEFSIKEKKADTVVFESRNPAADCKFMSGLAGGTPFELDKNGFFIHDKRDGRLEFPAGVWAGKRGTRFRFTVDMHLVQSRSKQWTLVLRNPVPLKNANYRIATAPGNSGMQRYVIEFTKPRDNFYYYFLIREGNKGKIKFDYVKIEKIEKK